MEHKNVGSMCDGCCSAGSNWKVNISKKITSGNTGGFFSRELMRTQSSQIQRFPESQESRASHPKADGYWDGKLRII